MFRSTRLRDTIVVNPDTLTREYQKHFLTLLQRQKERVVHPQVGAILKVEKLTKIDSPVAVNRRLLVKLEFEALVCKPEIGKVYQGKISMVIPLGLVIEAEGLVRVLIQPANMPVGYKFDPARKVFTNGIHSFNLQDRIRFRIVNVQYKPAQINCIGSLKDLPPVENLAPTKKVVLEEEILEPPDRFD